MAEVLSCVAVEAIEETLFTFSLLYSACFDIEVVKAHIRKVASFERIEMAHNMELIIKNRVLDVKYHFQWSRSSGTFVSQKQQTGNY